mmetsp:Transcript_60734/g.177425  ORF Transcript_60734/g.177425 Transcript_60734/m.177425 type:complete len:208 (-) Transcript_60734:159-782(-)
MVSSSSISDCMLINSGHVRDPATFLAVSHWNLTEFLTLPLAARRSAIVGRSPVLAEAKDLRTSFSQTSRAAPKPRVGATSCEVAGELFVAFTSSRPGSNVNPVLTAGVGWRCKVGLGPSSRSFGRSPLVEAWPTSRAIALPRPNMSLDFDRARAALPAFASCGTLTVLLIVDVLVHGRSPLDVFSDDAVFVDLAPNLRGSSGRDDTL